VSMRLLLMLVLWLTNRPTASSCTMSQEDLSRSRQAQVGFLGNTFWVSSAVVVFCHFRAYVSGCRFPFTALSWKHTSKKTFYTRTAPPHPLPPPQHALEPPLITRNVSTSLCVHSSPSSPSAKYLPCVEAATTRTQSMSCSSRSDEEPSTTIETHFCHLSILPSTPRLSLVG